MWFPKPLSGDSLPPDHVVLTFDDGPGPETLEIAQYLHEEQISAVFFVVGKHVRERPEIIERLRELGHIVGHHSVNHFHLTNSHSSIHELQAEVQAFEHSELVQYFRPPYGAWTPRLAHIYNNTPSTKNYVGPINWDVGGLDHQCWKEGKTAEQCMRYYQRDLGRRQERNGLVLLHDHGADGDQAITNLAGQLVRLLVPQFRDDGARFVSLTSIPDLQRAALAGAALQAR